MTGTSLESLVETIEADREVLAARASLVVGSSVNIAAVTFAALAFAGELSTAQSTLGCARFTVLLSLGFAASAFAAGLWAGLPQGVGRPDPAVVYQHEIEESEFKESLKERYTIAYSHNDARSLRLKIAFSLEGISLAFLVLSVALAVWN